MSLLNVCLLLMNYGRQLIVRKGFREKEKILLDAGYRIYRLQDRTFAIADPKDNEDGFYLNLAGYIELITTSYEHIFND